MAHNTIPYSDTIAHSGTSIGMQYYCTVWPWHVHSGTVCKTIAYFQTDTNMQHYSTFCYWHWHIHN